MSEKFQNTMGRGMIFFAWIMLLILLWFMFSDYLEHQNNPNRHIVGHVSNGERRVELQRNRQGHYVTLGRINDEKVTFLLDTGATDISIPEQVAKRLKLEPGFATQARTANGVITVYQTRLNKVEIGNIVLHDVRAHINPHMHSREILLGMSFLKQLEFTQKGDTLTITQHYF